jgi:hypothetical protein
MCTYLSTNWLQENDATCGDQWKYVYIRPEEHQQKGAICGGKSQQQRTHSTYTFHHLALFVKDIHVYVKDILLSTDPPMVRDILIFSDPPHNPPKLSFRANRHTKSQGAFLPNSMKKGKNLERLSLLLARHIFRNNSCVLGQ